MIFLGGDRGRVAYLPTPPCGTSGASRAPTGSSGSRSRGSSRTRRPSCPRRLRGGGELFEVLVAARLGVRFSPQNDRRFHRPRRWTDALGQRWADDERRAGRVSFALGSITATLVSNFDGHLAGCATELWAVVSASEELDDRRGRLRVEQGQNERSRNTLSERERGRERERLSRRELRFPASSAQASTSASHGLAARRPRLCIARARVLDRRRASREHRYRPLSKPHAFRPRR